MDLCNLSVIRELRSDAGITFRKEFGQNFLTDNMTVEDIADAANDDKDITVIEIGPGIGCMTRELCERYARVVAFEIDDVLIPVLKYTLDGYKNVTVINDDIMKADIADIVERYSDGMPVSVCANLPYYITSPIIMHLLESKLPIDNITVMVQKEVAERIASKPGKKAYGILSVLLQAYYDIEYLFTVDEHVFNPPPKVKSAVIRMTRNNRQGLGCDEALFKNIVKTAFNQRRKQMRNSLMGLVGKENPILNDPIFTKRPEQLSVDEFITLTQLIQNSN